MTRRIFQSVFAPRCQRLFVERAVTAVKRLASMFVGEADDRSHNREALNQWLEFPNKLFAVRSISLAWCLVCCQMASR